MERYRHVFDGARKFAVGLLSLGLVASIAGCPPDDDKKKKDTGTTEDTSMEDTEEMDTGDEEMDTSSEDTTGQDTVTQDTGGDDADGQDGGTARAMIIHNSADPAASTVDVFLNGNLLIDNFTFRRALSFRDVPAGEHDIAIAPKSAGSEGSDTTLDSGESAIGTFTRTFSDGETYVVVASGVRPGQGFASNPDGESIGLDLKVKAMAREDSMSDQNTDHVVVFHGATDAPTVDLRIDNRGVIDTSKSPNIESLTYGNFSDYKEVAKGVHTVDVESEDNSSRIASLQTGALPGGQAWVVVASGFAEPSNNKSGKALAFRAFPAKDSSQTDIIKGTNLSQAARVQLVHAAPESAVDPVDVWEKNSGKKLLDDVAYEAATPFLSLPGGVSLNLGVAPQGSSMPGDTVASQSVTFPNGKTRVVVASGVTNASPFENVSSPNFKLRAKKARESGANSGKVDVNIFHGATDAGAVDIATSGGTSLVSGLGFGSFTGITQLSPQNYTLDVTDTQRGATLSFDVNLQGAGGVYRTVVASGFVDAANDPVGSSTFKLLSVAPDGSVSKINPNP